MKNILKLLVLVVILSLFIILLRRCAKILNDETIVNDSRSIGNSVTLKWSNKKDNSFIVKMLCDRYNDWSNLPLSNNFRNKYNNYKDVCNELNDATHYRIVLDNDRLDDKEIYLIELSTDELYENLRFMQIEYEFIITNDGLIDDLERYNQYIIYGPTESVVEGPKNYKYSDVYKSIVYYLYNYETDGFEQYYDPMKINDNCQIINKPQIEDRSNIFYIDENILKGTPKMIRITNEDFENVTNYTLKWKLNEKYEFVYIEFINYVAE